jgi:sensor domain CHASE-containing protein
MQELLDERLSSLKRLSLDHSSFDATYRLVEHPDPSLDLMLFGENNQTNPLARQSGFLILLDNAGSIRAERKFYLPGGESREIPSTLLSQLLPGSKLMQHFNPTEPTSGVVMAPEGPLVVVSRAVLMTNGSGPSRGTLLVGRYLDAYDLGPMEKITGLPLTIQRLDQPNLEPEARDAAAHLSTGGPHTSVQRMTRLPGDICELTTCMASLLSF